MGARQDLHGGDHYAQDTIIICSRCFLSQARLANLVAKLYVIRSISSDVATELKLTELLMPHA